MIFKKVFSLFKVNLKLIIEILYLNKLTLIIIVVFTTLDQITKYLAKHYLEFQIPMNVIGDFFRLTLVFNKGISFGIFNTPYDSLFHLLLPFLSLIVIAFLVYLYYVLIRDIHIKLANLARIGFGLILAGSLGNTIDRIFLGKVTDFLDFGIGKIRWYTFNIADTCVTIGAILLIISSIISDIMKRKKYDNQKDF